MKSAISNIWLLGLVVLFIFVFSGYLAVTVNYTKTFKVKNEMLTIIEKQKGVVDISTPTAKNSIVKTGQSVSSNVGSLQIMALYLHGSAYRVTGTCDTHTESSYVGNKWYGVSDLGVPSPGSGKSVTPTVKEVTAGSKDKFYFCFARGKGKNGSVNYRIQVFYKMDLPVLGDLFTYRVEGTTVEIFNPTCDEKVYCSCGVGGCS
jgi:hypothetical protein